MNQWKQREKIYKTPQKISNTKILKDLPMSQSSSQQCLHNIYCSSVWQNSIFIHYYFCIAEIFPELHTSLMDLASLIMTQYTTLTKQKPQTSGSFGAEDRRALFTNCVVGTKIGNMIVFSNAEERTWKTMQVIKFLFFLSSYTESCMLWQLFMILYIICPDTWYLFILQIFLSWLDIGKILHYTLPTTDI